MNRVKDLGTDFKRKSGVKLLSCGCCCCCCCLHTVAAGVLFARSIIRSIEHAEPKGKKAGLGAPASIALILTPVIAVIVLGVGYGGNTPRGIGLFLLFAAPVLFPVAAMLSFVGAAIILVLSAQFESSEITKCRVEALDKIGKEYAHASAWSIGLAIPLFFATCGLAPVLGAFK